MFHRSVTTLTCIRPAGRLVARLRRSEGYSLIEVSVVMAALAVLLTASTSVVVSASQEEFSQDLRFRSQSAARLALDHLRADVHCGIDVQPLGASDDVTVRVPAGCARGVTGTAVEWCVRPQAGSQRSWELWRIPDPAVVAGRATPACQVAAPRTTKWADSLVYADAAFARTGYPFSFASPAAASGLLPSLQVSLPVSAAIDSTSRAVRPYLLTQGLTLVNGARG
jgi:prepilin-type N-terminal cleavage/methylation domain-containing protein